VTRISAIGAALTRWTWCAAEGVHPGRRRMTTSGPVRYSPATTRLRLRDVRAAAVKLLLDPRSRVVSWSSRAVSQLDDTRGPDGTSPRGADPGNQATLHPAEREQHLRRGQPAPRHDGEGVPRSARVPDWARADVAKAEPNRAAGGADRARALRRAAGEARVRRYSDPGHPVAAQYEGQRVARRAESGRYSPYQLLVVASLIERKDPRRLREGRGGVYTG